MKATVKKLSGMHGTALKAADGDKRTVVRIDTASTPSNAELDKKVFSFDVAGKKGDEGRGRGIHRRNSQGAVPGDNGRQGD